MKNTLGERIANIRKGKGFTQEQLADAARVNIRTIQRIESGETEPRGHTLTTIYDALEMNLENVSGHEKVKDKAFSVIFHASVMGGIFMPLGDIILPTILWAIKRDKVAGLEEDGKNLLVFRIIFDIFVVFTYFPPLIVGPRLFFLIYLLGTLVYPVITVVIILLNKKTRHYYPRFFK